MATLVGTERWMTIRVYPNLLHTVGAWSTSGTAGGSAPRPFIEQDIEAWMVQCARRGATAVLWQPNNGGLWTHPSPVFPLAGHPEREHNEAYSPVWHFLGEQVRRFDTLAVAVKYAHRHGLRLAYGYCPWDFVDSPFERSVFHPALWVLSRRGEPFHGVPCYAEPEAQQAVLAHLEAALDRGVDDLALCFFSHLQGHGIDLPAYYGYNHPVVEAYRARYGRDPRSLLEPPDGLPSVHGDFYTQFLRRLRVQTAGRGQRLVACTSYDGSWGWGGAGGRQVFAHCNAGDPPPSVGPACGIEFQYGRWATEGLVDALLVIAPPQASVATAERLAGQTGLPILLWHKIPATASVEQWDLYRGEARAARAGRIAGYVVHASVVVGNDEQTARLWDLLEAGR